MNNIPFDVALKEFSDLGPDVKPLFALDGKFLENVNISDIESMVNPKDIVSMSVLKGDAAVELYGEQGRSGVIQIVTKQE